MQEAETLHVTVRLFARYREQVGRSLIDLELPVGASVGDLARSLVRRYPRLPQAAESLVVAVNQEYQAHDHVLGDGDEVALIPPVSGGVSD